MLLSVHGIVRLSSEVELKYAPNGNAIASFSVASNERFKTKSGEQKENVCFIECTAFSKLAETCNRYLQKGKQVYIEGRLKLDQWTDQQGVKRSKHSITVETLQMIDSRKAEGSDAQPPQSNSNYQEHDIPDIDIDDEEIPF